MPFIKKKKKHTKIKQNKQQQQPKPKFYTVLASKGRGSKQQHLRQLGKRHKALFTQEYLHFGPCFNLCILL